MSCLELSGSISAIAALSAASASARDEISMVGSSTVFPCAQAVSERLANVTGARPPIVELTSSGGGMQLYWGGVGERFLNLTKIDLDLALAPRAQGPVDDRWVDTPRSAFDPIATAQVEEFFDKLRAQFSVVIVALAMQQAVRVIQKTGFFNLGNYVEFLETGQIITSPKGPRAQSYITRRIG